MTDKCPHSYSGSTLLSFQSQSITAISSLQPAAPPVRHRRQLREDGGGGALPAGAQLHAVLDHAGGLHRGARHRRHLLQVLIIGYREIRCKTLCYLVLTSANCSRAGAEFDLSLIWALVVAGLIAFTLQVTS